MVFVAQAQFYVATLMIFSNESTIHVCLNFCDTKMQILKKQMHELYEVRAKRGLAENNPRKKWLVWFCPKLLMNKCEQMIFIKDLKSTGNLTVTHGMEQTWVTDLIQSVVLVFHGISQWRVG